MPGYHDITQKSVNYDIDVTRRVINIDSDFRDSSSVTAGGGTSFGNSYGNSPVDFLFKLSTPVKNIARMEVKSVEMTGVTFAGNYTLLQLNDENSIESRSTAGKEIRAIAKIIKSTALSGGTGYFVTPTNGLVSNIVAFRNPQDVSVFRVRLVNPDGTVVTQSSGKLSITVELTEVVNSYLYESQRKHIGFDPANLRV